MITVGMKIAEVEDLLGPPDFVERDQEVLSSTIFRCHTEVAFVYTRKWRESLFVFLDHQESEVECVQRALFYVCRIEE